MARYRITNWHVSIHPGRGGQQQVASVLLMGHEDRAVKDNDDMLHRGGVSEHYQIPLTPDILAHDDLNKEVVRRAMAMSPNTWILDESASTSQDFRWMAEQRFAQATRSRPPQSPKKSPPATPPVTPPQQNTPTQTPPPQAAATPAPSGPASGQPQTHPELPNSAPRIYPGLVILAMDLIAGLAYLVLIGVNVSNPNQGGTTDNPLYSAAVAVILVGAIGLMVADWRGFWSLDGRTGFNWHTMKSEQQLGAIGCLFFFFPIVMLFWPPVYLVRATNAYFAAKRLEPMQRKRKIAELEAQLGIMPGTEGTCQSCGKPLQVKAEYCGYCGASTAPKPRICPTCSTTAPPDARFCAKCRTELSDNAAS